MTQDYPNLELTDSMYKKIQGKCCTSGCTNCPFYPMHKGLSGVANINPFLKAQWREIKIENARNDVFKTLTDAQNRIIRLIELEHATPDDIRSYFGSYYALEK